MGFGRQESVFVLDTLLNLVNKSFNVWIVLNSPGIGENGRFTNEEAYKMEIITYEIQSYHKSMACDIMRGKKKNLLHRSWLCLWNLFPLWSTLTLACTGRNKDNKHTITEWVYLFQHWRCSQLRFMGITVSFAPALSKDPCRPLNHWISLVLLASHCRKQKGGRISGYCFVFVVLVSPPCASTTNG